VAVLLLPQIERHEMHAASPLGLSAFLPYSCTPTKSDPPAPTNPRGIKNDPLKVNIDKCVVMLQGLHRKMNLTVTVTVTRLVP